jgi:hypothetical protein
MEYETLTEMASSKDKSDPAIAKIREEEEESFVEGQIDNILNLLKKTGPTDAFKTALGLFLKQASRKDAKILLGLRVIGCDKINGKKKVRIKCLNYIKGHVEVENYE